MRIVHIHDEQYQEQGKPVDGQVSVEAPAPADVLCEDTAEQWPYTSGYSLDQLQQRYEQRSLTEAG